MNEAHLRTPFSGMRAVRPVRAFRAIALVVAMSTVTMVPADAQQPRNVRIGALHGTGGRGPLDDIMEKRFGDLGWVSGRNATFVVRYGDTNDALPALARELVREQLDVILTSGTPASLAAKGATSTMPVVFYSVGDPVGVGLVASLGQPGGNVTGISGITYQLGAKRLELLTQLVPQTRLVGVLLNPTDPTVTRVFDALKRGVHGAKPALEPFYAGRPSELDGAFAAMKRRGVSGVIVQPDAMFWGQRATIVKLAAEARLPAIYAFREDVLVGGLICYGAPIGDMLEQAVGYADKILRGAKPSDLPVQEPTKLEFVVNAKTAKALGLTVPAALLLRADRVIE